MILVDTSVWIDHLRHGRNALADHLEQGQVVCHPFVTGELAGGNLGNRSEILQLLAALPSAPAASHEEALYLLEQAKLSGRGLGWVDLHLLAAARLGGYRLWTLDKALRAAAGELGVA